MSQTVKVLVVTDSEVGGFLDGDFHLGEFLSVLRATAWDGFGLQITTAHREDVNAAAVGANLVNFDFSSHDLTQYDEILLFPIRRDNASLRVPPGAPARSSNASAAEVAALARFMDGGGGVFATGDHEDLGAGLCARLPRVRNMRRWFWRAAGPNGEPPAPFGTPGLATEDELRDRHDTLVSGHDADPARPLDNFQFDDQSDNVAQRIQPRIFETRSSRYVIQRWPHPLLCSPEGTVRYLPDHAHEGQCEVPANLGLRVTEGGYDEEEYPVVGSGRLAPVVVADATVIGGHVTLDPFKPPVHGRLFGVIGAWDGHRAARAGQRMGRVVVDATWHHFFNINLTGDPASGEPAKRLGFRAPLNPGQPDHYRMIKHYFRNIVYWLIPQRRWRFVLYASASRLIRSGQFFELNPVGRLRDFERVELGPLVALGGLADAYFRRAHGACWTLQLLPIVLHEFDPFRRIWERLEPLADPWAPRPKAVAPLPWFDPAQLAHVALGATLLAAMQAHAEAGLDRGPGIDEALLSKSEPAFRKALGATLPVALGRFAEQVQSDARQLAEFSAQLDPLLKCK